MQRRDRLSPVLSDDQLLTWREELRAAAYTLDEVWERLGAAALAGLGRNSSLPTLRALGDAEDDQADAIRFWLLGVPLPAERVRALHTEVDALLSSGLVIAEGDDLRAVVELKPYGDETGSFWICADRTPLDGRVPPPRPDFVLGASPASTTLAQLIPRTPVGSALDLGTGCGIQALHLAGHCDRVIGTDLNPRALELARITAALSGVEVEFRLGSLYEPVAEQRFDLIVTNPPYVMTPPNRSGLVYREGTEAGDGLMRRVVAEAAERLNPGGTLIVLGNWAITDEPWSDRVAGWIPPGCDALVLQREQLDPFEYVELWLADAGLAGTDDYQQRYREWLDYFDDLGITSIGMGWIAVRAAGRERPEIRCEEWPHLVHQPVGAAFDAFFAAVDQARLPDDEFVSSCWTLHPDVIQETIADPGAADPQHLILRQQFGFGRAVEPGTALAAVVGACDGELPLSVLIDAVASLTGTEGTQLRAELLPLLRRLVSEGFLTQS